MAPFNLRHLSAKILRNVSFDNISPKEAITTAFDKSKLNELDKSLVNKTIYGVLRWQGKIDYIIKTLSTKKKLDSDVINILRTGIYQLLYLERVPPYAIINECVKAIKAPYKKGFVNAILRKISRQNDKTLSPSPLPLSPGGEGNSWEIIYSHPKWIIDEYIKKFGKEKTKIILKINNKEPEQISIRVNGLKTSKEEIIRKINGMPASKILDSRVRGNDMGQDDALIISDAKSADLAKLHSLGLFSFQGISSQCVSKYLAPKEGETILDACCGVGGKTTHLAELMNNKGRIIALDNDENKLSVLKENVKRLGITNIEIINNDATKFKTNIKFDKILIDAPCSGLGTLQRRPEIKWQRKKQDLDDLSKLQFAILKNVSAFLKKEGEIIYSVCTITQKETYDVIKHADFTSNDIRETPISDGIEGFFMAKICSN